MAERNTMRHLVAFMRKKLNDKGPTQAFTGDELEHFLDMHRFHVQGVELAHDPDYLNYYSDMKMWEDTVSLRDSRTDSYTTYTPTSSNLYDGTFTFATAQDLDLYIFGECYNVDLALAEAFECITADADKYSSYTRGGVSWSRKDIFDLASYYRQKGGSVRCAPMDVRYD